MAEQRIRLLDEITINQIAAGEVIENPASVVKELVENSLDSGARSIHVETRGGGRGLIRISDDGCGMSKEDLIFSLERHATSKLTGIEDFDTLHTLGFRGEALPSIASVSKLCIHSAAQEGEGEILVAHGGKIMKIDPKPRKQGTTVEVASLFFNVPVRKKFQKSVGWDTSEIHKVLTKMALCYQEVAFTWISEGVKENGLIEEKLVQEMLSVEHRKGDFVLKGFCSPPGSHRPNRTGQYLFVNKRPVVSPFIAQKILEGYGTRLTAHRFPLFVLHLNLPSPLIDVNVHPQKKEIRLREERDLGIFLIEAIERALCPNNRKNGNFDCAKTSSFSSVVNDQRSLSLPPPAFAVEESFSTYEPKTLVVEKEPLLFSFTRSMLASVGNYVFLQEEEGIRVVDLCAARMRIVFEQLKQGRDNKEVQHLLIPIEIEVRRSEQEQLCHAQSLFEEVGIGIRSFGNHSLIVDAIPPFFEREEIPGFVHALLEEGDLPKALSKTLRAPRNQRKDLLVEALFKCKEPDHAPDGRATHVLLKEKELAKFFK